MQSNTPIFNIMLQRGLRKIRRNKIPMPQRGTVISLLSKSTKKGRWEVDLFHGDLTKKLYVSARFIRNEKKGHISFDHRKIKELK